MKNLFVFLALFCSFSGVSQDKSPDWALYGIFNPYMSTSFNEEGFTQGVNLNMEVGVFFEKPKVSRFHSLGVNLVGKSIYNVNTFILGKTKKGTPYGIGTFISKNYTDKDGFASVSLYLGPNGGKQNIFIGFGTPFVEKQTTFTVAFVIPLKIPI